MKLAIYTGSNQIEDFHKIEAYAGHASNRPISVIFFNTLNTAMTWLGFSEYEQEQMKNQLREQ